MKTNFGFRTSKPFEFFFLAAFGFQLDRDVLDVETIFERVLDAIEHLVKVLAVVHHRVSEPGGTRQVYFLLFDAPAIGQFRRQIGLDPADLAPILFIAGAGPDFNSWLPQRATAECLAPVEVAD